MQGRPSSGTKAASLPPNLDLWEPGPFTDLPPDLVSAFERQDWPALKEELATVMDSVTTDGIYGRELLQLVRNLPIGVEPVFTRYRAAAAVDYGDWDDLKRCLATNPIESEDLEGLRDIWLAPLDRKIPPSSNKSHYAFVFEFVEMEHERAYGALRRWARQMPKHTFTSVIWAREDIPASRHFQYRRLLDAVFLAIGEAQGGRLEMAQAFAQQGQALGDEGEPLRFFAHDLGALVQLARGRGHRFELQWPSSLTRATGCSPNGAWEMTCHLLPFLALSEDGSFHWSARLVEKIAARMASPRALLHSQTWRLASDLLTNRDTPYAELRSLLVRARSATPGLRALPELLNGYATRRHSAFVDALDVARRAGNAWIQVSALVWMAALDPTPWVVRSLYRLLEVTGWRKPLFVPSQVAGDAALALIAGGMRGSSVIELALLAGRSNVTVEAASRHLEDATCSPQVHACAARALAKVGTSRSREILERLSAGHGPVSEIARSFLARPATAVALSDRELEVIDLVSRGLTNREIAVRLGLSAHTVARHVANARNKLGAANRMEAVSRLRGLADAD